MFRAQRGLLDTRACDVEDLAASDGIRIDDAPPGQLDFTAALVIGPGVAGILLAHGQDGARRRFSVAHELGHYHMPTHQGSGFMPCSEEDMRARKDDESRAREREANEFASELLMPFQMFAADADRHEPSVATARLLASEDMYKVSVTAAAFRIVETTRTASMLVVSAGGVVKWSVGSRSWQFRRPFHGDPLPRDSAAHFVVLGEDASGRPESVPTTAWLPLTVRPNAKVLESTHPIGATGEVLSLIWLPDPDSTSE